MYLLIAARIHLLHVINGFFDSESFGFKIQVFQETADFYF